MMFSPVFRISIPQKIRPFNRIPAGSILKKAALNIAPEFPKV